MKQGAGIVLALGTSRMLSGAVPGADHQKNATVAAVKGNNLDFYPGGKLLNFAISFLLTISLPLFIAHETAGPLIFIYSATSDIL